MASKLAEFWVAPYERFQSPFFRYHNDTMHYVKVTVEYDEPESIDCDIEDENENHS